MISDNSYLLAVANKTFNIIKFLSTFGIFLAKTGGHCRRAHLAAAPAARLSTKGRRPTCVHYLTGINREKRHSVAGGPPITPAHIQSDTDTDRERQRRTHAGSERRNELHS